MNLQQMILEARRALDGLTDQFWTDSELTDWLNEGAKIMAADAQPIQSIKQISSVANRQEYDLGPDVDEIYAVKYFKGGNLYDLHNVQQAAVQWGGTQSGHPLCFYTRVVTSQTAGQGTDGDIDLGDTDYPATTVLGLHPIPSTAGETLTIFYFARHMNMKFPKDVSPIPLEFHRGIVAYAIALGKMKEEAYAEATNVYMPIFNEFKERLKTKMINRGQETNFPKAKIVGDDMPHYGGTSVIFLGEAT